MDPVQVITLFDSIWFKNQIFLKHPPESILETNPDQKTLEINSETELPKLPTIHLRSSSDQLSSIMSFSDSVSPNSVLMEPQLHTIFSGKEVKYEAERKREGETESNKQRRRRRKTKVSSKSLTDLEFEELKGFMDLGFVFSEEDKKSNLVEIIPGLQRLGKKEGDIVREMDNSDEIIGQRPYLSEAWMSLRDKKKINPLVNWKFKDLGSEIDVKQSLKLWAHSVASTVR